MNTWQNVLQKVNQWPLSSDSWKSDKGSLASIIKKAVEWDLDPNDAVRASISNLRTIVSRAKSTIRHNDKAALAQLFSWAAELTTANLRIKLDIPDRVEIRADVLLEEANPKVQVSFTMDQFAYIENVTKLKFFYTKEA